VSKLVERYEVLGKRNVQLLHSGVTILSGEKVVVEGETEEMKRAKKNGLIDYVAVVEPKVESKVVIPESKLREAAKDLGVKDHATKPIVDLKKLVETKVDGTPKKVG